MHAVLPRENWLSWMACPSFGLKCSSVWVAEAQNRLAYVGDVSRLLHVLLGLDCLLVGLALAVMDHLPLFQGWLMERPPAVATATQHHYS